MSSEGCCKPIECTIWDGSVNKEIEDFSVVWGIVENEETGQKIVKFNLKFEEQEFNLWISDKVSLMTMQKMLEDALEQESVKPEELVDDVNEILSKLRQRDRQGWQFETSVKSLCESWHLNPEQTKKVMALMIAVTKLVEECFIKQSVLPYIY